VSGTKDGIQLRETGSVEGWGGGADVKHLLLFILHACSCLLGCLLAPWNELEEAAGEASRTLTLPATCSGCKGDGAEVSSGVLCSPEPLRGLTPTRPAGATEAGVGPPAGPLNLQLFSVGGTCAHRVEVCKETNCPYGHWWPCDSPEQPSHMSSGASGGMT
jgi:hypothetical protein